MPMCASVMPQAPRGRPQRAAPDLGQGARNARTRSAASVSAPEITQAPSATPAAASRLRGVTSPKVASAAASATQAGEPQPPERAGQVAALPGQQRPDRQRDQRRRDERARR